MAKAQGVTLMNLRQGHCHFIINEEHGPDRTRYCGQTAVTGSSWCPEHRSVCVTTVAPRIRVPSRR